MSLFWSLWCALMGGLSGVIVVLRIHHGVGHHEFLCWVLDGVFVAAVTVYVVLTLVH